MGGAIFLIISIVFLVAVVSTAYYWGLLLAAMLVPRSSGMRPAPRKRRFILAIAAHDEASVIAATIRRAKALDYPADLFEIQLVADHCSDDTAERARAAGATVHERNEGERGSKGAALAWLFERLRGRPFDALILFDADASADSPFLVAMDAALEEGHEVIQGQQVISNPESGWYAALTAAMYRIESLIHNEGRSRLGGSARHMGDAICFRRNIVEAIGFGSGLTEDHHLRQELALRGTRIAYEPRAVARNEAARTWEDAKRQRRRWMQGTLTNDRSRRWAMFRTGLSTRNGVLLDIAFESLVPSFSTLAALVVVMSPFDARFVPLVIAVAAFPFVALACTRAPKNAYSALLTGPFFIAWRVWTSVWLRVTPGEVRWVRTPHGERE